MFKLKFKKSEIPENELSYENLKIVSKTHDLMIIMNAITGWFKSNPDCKTTDLEKKLREDKLDIHLISAELEVDKNKYKMILPYNMSEECDRMIIYSCRPEKEALEELLTHAKSYDENFARLNNAGIIMDRSIKEIVEVKKDFEEQTDFERLKDVSGLVELKIDTFEDVFNGCIKFFKEKYGEEPEISLIGMGINGEAVNALTYKGRLCCPVGIMIGYKEDEKLIKYININDKKTWVL